MSNAALDVLCIGNAIVDVLAQADDEFLKLHDIDKGAMTLISERQANRLYAAMGPGREVSGGSAANTAAGVASFGAAAGYIGKVKDDQLGAVFTHDLTATGVEFTTLKATDGPSTARCLINVTPDAQRTMCTYLGACVELDEADIDADQVKRSKIVYLEGYLFDPPAAKRAFAKAAEIARASDTLVALTLSDGFCVDRHREDFHSFIDQHVDILFANEAEIKSFAEVDDFDEAARKSFALAPVVALTRSEKGAIVYSEDGKARIPAGAPEKLVDTTGAGDLFAAGFLYGYAAGRSPEDCARLGVMAATEIISHFGARPETPLNELGKQAGFIT